MLVVGAGIVGLAAAVEAQRRGRQVTLIDRDQPGHGCSLGNAGIIAVSEIFPLITPTRVLALPGMLLSRDAPVVVRGRSLPRVLPWMLRASCTLLPTSQEHICTALTALNLSAIPAWRSLLTHCDASQLLRENGMVRLIRNAADQAELHKTQTELAARGLPSRMLNRSELRELEPNIGDAVVGGLLHDSDADIGDPLLVSNALLTTFLAAGGQLLQEAALTLTPTEYGVQLATASGLHQADQALITLGVDAASLLAPLGITAPLQAERGYHLMMPGAGSLLRRPVTFQRESCVASAMGGDLRLAGTVEFADASAPPDWSRADRLAAHAAPYFNAELPLASARRWIGSRPSLPDSLPAIGRLRAAPAIGYAFGHHHLGVTQAAISAFLLGRLMNDETPHIDCRAYDIARFN